MAIGLGLCRLTHVQYLLIVTIYLHIGQKSERVGNAYLYACREKQKREV